MLPIIRDGPDASYRPAAPRGIRRDGGPRRGSVRRLRALHARPHHRSRPEPAPQKRGGQFEVTSLDTSAADPAVDPAELSRISDALDQLAATDPALAEIVDVKFFCGFSFAEVAAMRQVSERTGLRSWEKARIYLYCAISATLDG
jgi:hypothetical protein